MCGIAGIIGNNIVDEYIHKMTSAISHRGPDAEGFWNDGQCFFGHRRLSIIDLSDAANQPMVSHCGRYVMVYNGEIYNFKEIRHELNISCKTNSDTEVILEAFVILGPDFVHRLNGMFAIAIWDIEEKKLSLFRDRMGVKPIFYYHHNGMFAFASEIKSLLSLPQIKSQLSVDRDAIALYLQLGYIPHPFTAYSQIKKFPQGSRALYSKDDFSFDIYWKPEDHVAESIIEDRETAFETLEFLLKDSVSKRLVSDVPFGAFLSGGVDSSLVAALAQSCMNEPLNTFTIGFAESRFNEATHAAKIASFLGTKHHEFILEEKLAMDLLPDILSVYDEPYADSSAIPSMLVCKFAKQQVTMVLSGDGGDELFMGYGAYVWAQRMNNMLLQSMRLPARVLLSMGNAIMQRASWLFNYDIGDSVNSHIFSQEQYLFSAREIRGFYKDTFYGHFDEGGNENTRRKLTPSELQSKYDMHYYLPDDLLVKMDRASMKYSVEVRVPLLDYRIVEFVWSLSHKLKIQKKSAKYLLKEVLYKRIPSEYFERPKQGFAIPLSSWLRTSMKSFAMDHLNSQVLKDFLEVSPLQIPSIKKWVDGNDLYYNRVWQLIVLSMWLKRQ
jgi:asparagine synthase (glutamine-hydrolysing)